MLREISQLTCTQKKLKSVFGCKENDTRWNLERKKEEQKW